MKLKEGGDEPLSREVPAGEKKRRKGKVRYWVSWVGDICQR